MTPAAPVPEPFAVRSGPPLFVLVAPSATGKTTVLRHVLALEPQLVRLITATTRPRRSDERDRVDYYFLDDRRFDELEAQSAFIERSDHFAARYGLLASELERLQTRPGIVVLDIDGTAAISRRYHPVVRVFLRPQDPSVLRERLARRAGEDSYGSALRLERIARELAVGATYEHTVVNDRPDRAAVEIVEILRRGWPRM